MKKQTIKVKLTFQESILGSQPGNKQVAEEFIASKAETAEASAEEVQSIPDMLEKGTTCFSRTPEGALMVWDYQIRGMFKEQLAGLVELGEVKTISKWGVKKAVDSVLYVNPRRVVFTRDGKPITSPDGYCERPLRAETMQGDRVALARSEEIREGASIEFEVVLLISDNSKSKYKITKDDVVACLEYGTLRGFGQWRNSGKGRFTFEVECQD